MSLTKSGSRIGMAKHIENREIRDYIESAQAQTIQRKREWSNYWWATLETLQALDPNWESWYDARPEQTAGEMLPLIEDRIARLKAYDQIAPSDQEESNRIQDWLTSNWNSIAEIPL